MDITTTNFGLNNKLINLQTMIILDWMINLKLFMNRNNLWTEIISDLNQNHNEFRLNNKLINLKPMMNW
jgi:hypothetical protein